MYGEADVTVSESSVIVAEAGVSSADVGVAGALYVNLVVCPDALTVSTVSTKKEPLYALSDTSFTRNLVSTFSPLTPS